MFFHVMEKTERTFWPTQYIGHMDFFPGEWLFPICCPFFYGWFIFFLLIYGFLYVGFEPFVAWIIHLSPSLQLVTCLE